MEPKHQPEWEETFSRPARQSPVAIAFLLLDLVKNLISRFWPLLIAFFVGRSRTDSTGEWLAKVGLVFSTISVIGSIIAYFRLYYYVEEGELVLEKGWLRKLKLNIPIDRIQSVNFEQTPLHRLLGTLKVEIDTAGSQSQELSLVAIKREKAQALRAFLLAEREKMGGLKTEDELAEGEEGSLQQASPERVLLHLGVKDLLRAGLSENPLKGLGVIVAVFGFLVGEISSLFGDNFLEVLEDLSGLNIDGSLGNIILASLYIILPVLLLASWLLTFGLTVINHYGLRLWRTPEGYRQVAGMFRQKERSTSYRKVQMLMWSTQPLQRMFGMFRLKLYLAGSESNIRNQMNLVGAYGDQVSAVRNSIFGEREPEDLMQEGIHPKAFYRRFLFTGIVPGLGLAGLMWGWGSLLAVPWLVVTALLARRYQRRWRWGVDEEVIFTHQSVIGERNSMLWLYKVQHVSVSQSFYEKRHGLASVLLSSAAGRTLRVPYLSLERAQLLRDYVVYRIETDARPWM
jgi:putative membrane protein